MGKKQAYAEKLQAQMEEFNAKIDALKAKASRAEGSSSKLGYYDKLEAMVLKRDLAKSKLEELQNGIDGA